MKTSFQAGPGGRVSVPPGKRFPINPKKAEELRIAYEAWAKRVGALPWNEVNVKKKKKK